MSTLSTITYRSRRILFLAATVLLAFTSSACNDSAAQTAETGVFYGAAVKLGNGTARTYVMLADGEPTEVGVAFSEQALQNLPTGGHDAGTHKEMTEHVLALPPQGGRTPYQFVLLGWNPQGHPPEKIYDTPHFDFHFYTITDAERTEIDPALPNFEARAARIPTKELVPSGVLGEHELFQMPPTTLTIPRMGLHWIDPKTPELNGQPFTATFIYGSWDGRMIFAEPMITKAFLESRPQFSAAVGQPQQYGAAGYYPTRYSVRWDEHAREYRIALTGLTKRAD